ncbi:MAG: TIGR02206 family membrane protein, partial [Actinomycetota bacterium]|nr:TIGR02206 family membrane protein [Actinomycetota bacterium]
MELWSTEHVVALALSVVSCVLAVRLTRARPRAWGATASRVLAALIALAFAADHSAAAILGEWSLDHYLPLHLSDVATILAVLALWQPRPLLVELTYFWGLTASVQATLTPDLGHTFPDVLFFTFFVTHAGVVLAALLLVAGRGLVPRPGAVARVF